MSPLPRPRSAPPVRHAPRGHHVRPPWGTRWRRARRARIAVLGLLALLAGVATASFVADAADRAEAWGPRRRVAVATRDLDPGELLTSESVAWHDLPVAVVPDDAVTVDPAGRPVAERILRDEVVRGARLGATGASGLAARLPPGWLAVALPADDRTPPVRAGDRADLYVATAADPTATEPTVASGNPAARPPSGRRLTAGARVLEVTDRRVTVAVPRADAAELTAAIATSTVILAVSR